MRRTCSGILLVAAFGIGLHAQQPSAAAGAPTLSGMWNRLDTAGGDSYEGIDAMFAKAQLLPAAEARLPPEQPRGRECTAAGPVAERRLPDAAGGRGRRALPDGRTLQHRRRVRWRHRHQFRGHGHHRLEGRGRDRARRQRGRSPHLPRSEDAGCLAHHPVGWRLLGGSLGERRACRHHDRVRARASSVLDAAGRSARPCSPKSSAVVRQQAPDDHLHVERPDGVRKPHTHDLTFERWEAGYVFETWCDASIDHPENYTSVVLAPATSGTDKK